MCTVLGQMGILSEDGVGLGGGALGLCPLLLTIQ